MSTPEEPVEAREAATHGHSQPGADNDPQAAAPGDSNLGDPGTGRAEHPAAAPGNAPSAQAAPTQRNSTAIGIGVVVLCLAVAGYFAIVGPAGADEPGKWNALLRWAAPTLWVGLAGVAAAWTAGVRRSIVNGAAGVLLTAYIAYLIVRMF